MIKVLRPVSSCLPEVWVERGGPALAALLAALDDSWTSTATVRPSFDTPAAWDLLVAATGWQPLLDEIGGVNGVRNPEQLLGLLAATFRGDPVRLSEWLSCLFGFEVRSLREEPPVLRARVVGPRPTNADALLRVVRRLTLAHVEVNADSILWCQEGDNHD